MPDLWGKNDEQRFFEESLASGVPAGDLFYKTDTGRMVAYWEKNYVAEKGTLQSRNSHIGKFTEIWVKTYYPASPKKATPMPFQV